MRRRALAHVMIAIAEDLWLSLAANLVATFSSAKLQSTSLLGIAKKGLGSRVMLLILAYEQNTALAYLDCDPVGCQVLGRIGLLHFVRR